MILEIKFKKKIPVIKSRGPISDLIGDPFSFIFFSMPLYFHVSSIRCGLRNRIKVFLMAPIIYLSKQEDAFLKRLTCPPRHYP